MSTVNNVSMDSCQARSQLITDDHSYKDYHVNFSNRATGCNWAGKFPLNVWGKGTLNLMGLDLRILYRLYLINT
jgi:hypothetical protein